MQFNFEENQHVETLDGVPDNFQPFFKANEAGGFDFRKDDPAVSAAVSTITGMSIALDAERGVTAALKKQKVDLTPLKEFGGDIESIAKGVNERISQLKDAGGADADKKIENLKTSMAQAHATEVQKLSERNKGLQGQLYTQLVTTEATTAIAEHKGNAELLINFVSNQVKVEESDGQLTATVVDANGAPKYNGMGQPMSVTELVGTMKKDKKYAALFQSEARPGGGTPPNTSSQRAPAPGEKDTRNPTQKLSDGLKAKRDAK